MGLYHFRRPHLQKGDIIMRYVNFYLSVLFICLFSMTASAGDLDSSGDPTAGSGMYSLEDIYNRLDTGAWGTSGGPFKEPSAGPAATGHNLNDVMGKAPEIDTSGATPANVGSGKTFWGLGSGNWGLQTGTMETKTLSPDSADVAAGYYNDTTLDTVDSDLTEGNIRSTVTIFGVAGDTNVVNTSSGDASAGDILKDKKAWVNGSELSGTRYGGCTCTGTLYENRWCDNGNGTVTDLTTCLVWLQKADWGGLKKWGDCTTYDDANTRAGLLYVGASAALYP
jgi:hypothetical protein